MTNIELVIKISEEDFDDILNGEVKASAINWSTFNAIRNGTVLPKGHGDLKDVNNLYEHVNGGDYDGTGFSKEYVYCNDIANAPTIIEAESEE